MNHLVPVQATDRYQAVNVLDESITDYGTIGKHPRVKYITLDLKKNNNNKKLNC